MKIPRSVFVKFWQFTQQGDAKRMAAQTPTPGVEELADIPYIEDGLTEHLLDVYFPEGNEKLPLIIDIHGGGWMYGNKEINKYYNYYLASKGFKVVSINYRLCPQATVPSQVRDIFAALNWVDKNGEKYGFDMENVFITGDSAGAHLAAICCAAMDREDLRRLYRVEKPSYRFSAAGFVCGAFDVKFIFKLSLAEEYAKIMLGEDYKTSPYRNSLSMSDIMLCDTKLPPIWMVTSSEDFIGFLSKGFHKLLNEKGCYHVYKKWDKSTERMLPHVFCVTNPEYPESRAANDSMTGFFNKYVK